jgi:FtsP/CotA-like multicopper oxidase with cupredoxin domain
MSRLASRMWALALLSIVTGAAAATADELTFDIKIEHGQIPDAMRLMRVHQGDSVTLRWTSGQPLILHLHGYDIEKRVAADGVTEMAFTAYATGRFPIEIHAQGTAAGGAVHASAPLAVIEVYPR